MDSPERQSEANDALFRNEVYAARLERMQGTILLAYPPSFRLLTAVALLCLAATVAFVLVCSYTRREVVEGSVASDLPVAKLYAPAEGIVLQKLVADGEKVRAGQTLFIISTETRSPGTDGNESAIAAQLLLEAQALEAEKSRRKQILDESRTALESRVRNLREALGVTEQEDSLQRIRVSVDERNLDRLKGLTEQGFFPRDQFDTKMADLLDQRAKLAAVDRALVDTRTDLRTAQSELENAPLQAQNEISQFDRQLSELKQQHIQNDGHRQISIVSEVDGIATTPLVDAGDTVSPATLMVTVLPAGAHMVAQLYVPSRAIGFVKTGTPVTIRYDAFPFQKFGQYWGHVTAISRVALAPGELRTLDADGHEAVYRVTAALEGQSVQAESMNIPVEDGMKFEADLMLENRKIYEWMLEPLYTLTERLPGKT